MSAPASVLAARGQDSARGFPTLGLLALASGVFLSLTTEVLPAGLLPELAAEYGTTTAVTGLLVSLFAAAVVLLTIPSSFALRRLPRKPLVVAALLLMLAACVVSATAPNFEVLAASRVICGIAQGLFWSVVSAYPAHLVSKDQLPRAMAMLTIGGSSAAILGVPLGTALGQALGWSAPFLVIAGLLLVSALVILFALPPVGHYTKESGEHRRVDRDETVPSTLALSIAQALIVMAHMATYTYVIPWLRSAVDLPDDGSAVPLMAFGVAGTLGTLLAARVIRVSPRFVLPLFGAVVVAALLTLGLATGLPTAVSYAVFVLWGFAYGGTPMFVQTLMMANASYRLRDTAAAFHTTAYNVGMMTGPIVGGLLFGAVGLEILPAFAALPLIVGVTIAATVAIRRARAAFAA